MFTLDNLTVLTDAELRERLDDALLAQDEPVDDMTTDHEYRENLPNLVRGLMDETHARALRMRTALERWHIPSVDCWCDPGYDQAGQFFKHHTDNGQPAIFEPPIVPGAEQDADGYAREDHR